MGKKAIFWQEQFDIIAECVISLLQIPFPHAKSVRIGLIFNVICKPFGQPLSDYMRMDGNEAKVLLFIMPRIMTTSMKVMRSILATCKTSVILYLAKLTEFVRGVLFDLRDFTESFAALRSETYQLLIDICETFKCAFGLERHCKDIVGYVLSDIVPKKPSVKTTPPVNQKR